MIFARFDPQIRCLTHNLYLVKRYKEQWVWSHIQLYFQIKSGAHFFHWFPDHASPLCHVSFSSAFFTFFYDVFTAKELFHVHRSDFFSPGTLFSPSLRPFHCQEPFYFIFTRPFTFHRQLHHLLRLYSHLCLRRFLSSHHCVSQCQPHFLFLQRAPSP